jgi:hypothetical protein
MPSSIVRLPLVDEQNLGEITAQEDFPGSG